MNIVLNLLWCLLFAYLGIYLVYKYVLIIAAWRGRYIDLRKKNLSSSVQRHITVVVYAQNNFETIIDLAKSLDSQDYPKDKYRVNVILDGTTDGSEKVLGLIESIKIWNTSSSAYDLGMYPSISKFVENDMASNYTNAYVFLNASAYVKENFLERVNLSLENSTISQACIATSSPYSNRFNNAGYLSNRINNRINIAGQFHLGLSTNIQDSGLIVTQEFLEKNPMVIKPGESEKDYNFELLKDKTKVNWAPEVVVYNRIASSVKELAFWRSDNFIKNLIVFLRNKLKAFKNALTINYCFNIFAPSRFLEIIIILLLCILGLHSGINILGAMITVVLPFVLLVLILFNDLYGMYISRCKLYDLKTWLLSPVIYLQELFYIISFSLNILKIKMYMLNQLELYSSDFTLEYYEPETPEKIQITVTDGKASVDCELEIRSYNGLNQLVFIFKGKRFSTKPHKTIDLAFDELNSKLMKKNFRILCCYNCGYFSFSNQSHSVSEGSEGHCFFGMEGQNLLYEDVNKIWYVCNKLIPLENRDQILEDWKKSLE